ncbi:MAG: TAXI family TRAP transporter solute-binding subunit [Acidobacteriota bacterium]
MTRTSSGDAASSSSPATGDEGRRELLRVWVPVVVLAVLAFAFAFRSLEPPAPDTLTLAAGTADGAYAGFAERYRTLLAEHGKELVILETAGSVENLRRLNAGEVDLALLQGGIADSAEATGLESIASLFFEPVWLFHRADQPLQRVTDLAGLRVAVGGPDSGTRRLAEQILAANGLPPQDESDSGGTEEEGAGGTPRLVRVERGGGAAADALLDGSVDAAFFVASPEASYVPRLLAANDIELMDFRRTRAYRVEYPFLSAVTLAEGVVDLEKNLPPRDVELIAAAASLATSPQLHHALVPLLVETARDVHGDLGVFAERDTFPSAAWVDLPLKTEAEHYLENGPSFLFRVLPYRTAVSVDRLKIFLLPFIPLLIVVFKAAPPLYRWRIRSKIFRWYRDLRALDQFVLSGPRAEDAVDKLAEVRRLEQEVTEVSVPLSYMDAFYDLRVHIELIEKKLEEIVRDEEVLA